MLDDDKPATSLPTADSSFMHQLEGLLDTLVPPDAVVVKTHEGVEHKLPAALPARRQVRAFRHMRELLEMEQVQAAMAQAKGGLTTQGIIDIVVSVATDEAVMEKLGEAFNCAYPDTFEGTDALDVLPLEEVIGALLPFTKRFLHKLGTGLQQVAELASQQ